MYIYTYICIYRHTCTHMFTCVQIFVCVYIYMVKKCYSAKKRIGSWDMLFFRIIGRRLACPSWRRTSTANCHGRERSSVSWRRWWLLVSDVAKMVPWGCEWDEVFGLGDKNIGNLPKGSFKERQWSRSCQGNGKRYTNGQPKVPDLDVQIYNSSKKPFFISEVGGCWLNIRCWRRNGDKIIKSQNLWNFLTGKFDSSSQE